MINMPPAPTVPTRNRPGTQPLCSLTHPYRCRQSLELARGHAHAGDEPSDADGSLLRPAPDEIHDTRSRTSCGTQIPVRDPKTFFSAMCSIINSARTSSLVCTTFFSENSIPFLLLLHLAVGTPLRLKSGGSVLEQFFLPAVEHCYGHWS